jgi:hypothetical protein
MAKDTGIAAGPAEIKMAPRPSAKGLDRNTRV